MRVKEIHFNHGPTSGAIPLSHKPGPGLDDRPIPITAPEWNTGDSEPVAYARSEVKSVVTIKVRLTGGPPNKTVKIRAVGPLKPAHGKKRSSRTTTVLGTVNAKSVKFNTDGESGLVAFQLSGKIQNAAVTKVQVTWDWQAQAGGNNWIDVETTSHLVYITLVPPTNPWLNAGAEMMSKAWVEAIQLACDWSEGATTVDDCVLFVAERINKHPRLSYDESGTQFVKNDVFQLAAFLSALQPSTGSFTIDCQGVANALVTFANILGGNLRLLVIENDVGDLSEFTTHPIFPLRGPDWIPKTWDWHEVAVHADSPVFDAAGTLMGGATIADDHPLIGKQGQGLRVYDANIHLTKTNVPPVFPIGIRLGNAGSGDQEYRDRFLADSRGAKVTPYDANPAE